jgi:OPA family glycerol-3-phosphate transporter-like MFS transporter
MHELVPIALILVAVTVVIARLPRVEVGHSDAFRKRRLLNWLPLGLTYAFLYMGRYNLNATTPKILSTHDYGTIFAVGAWVYGVSFLVNGPLADRLGGRTTILIGAFGSGLMNVLMGLAARSGRLTQDPVLLYSVLYGANMYFQSFGAVSIIKVNSAWFHVRERGVFGGIFGILISLGLYFAYDWGSKIVKNLPIEWLFLIPAGILFLFFVITLACVRDTPADAGQLDFDPGDASSGDTGPRLPVLTILGRMLSNPVIMIIASIEFCSGFLRDSMTHWYKTYAGAIAPAVIAPGDADQLWVSTHWGMLLCVAGILGGSFAGIVSDRLFQSRRPPVAAVLYTIMLTGAIALVFALRWPLVSGIVLMVMVMSVLGVHGVLSGTASADFGGKKNAGVATGIVDGFVYAGVGIQSLILGSLLPEKGGTGLKDPAVIDHWNVWPKAMIPVAMIGLLLATRVWNAKPKGASAPAKPPRRGDRATQTRLLDQALEVARAAGSKGVVAFDLDSTLFDNRPRQAAIVRDWARTKGGYPELEKVEANHLDGWDLRVAMVNAGLARDKAEQIFPEAKAYWRDRFFTSEWCKLDVSIPGAVAFVAALAETGVQIAYVTGRHEPMRAGTVECLGKEGFPAPDGKGVHLVMKPTLEEEDDAFKKRAYEQLREKGRVVAAFDNEPIHVNGYKTAFPEAHVVHLDTDSSGRPVAVLASIPSVLDFVRA